MRPIGLGQSPKAATASGNVFDKSAFDEAPLLGELGPCPPLAQILSEASKRSPEKAAGDCQSDWGANGTRRELFSGAGQVGAEQFVVAACGRNLAVDRGAASSVLTLQASLQRLLGMEGQSFCLFDANGTSLDTDGLLHEAVSEGRVPIAATLTDASIHYIENRREELAHMQWKLMRDQVSKSTTQASNLARSMAEFEAACVRQIHEQLQAFDHFKVELAQSQEAAREEFSLELRQANDRVNALAHMVTGDAAKRDTRVSNLESRSDSLQDVLDTEVSERMKEGVSLQASVQELRRGSLSQSAQLSALENRQSSEHKVLRAHVGEVRIAILDGVKGDVDDLRRAVQDSLSNLDDQYRRVERLRLDLENSCDATKRCFASIEERYDFLSARVSEAASRHATSIDRIFEHQERVSRDVDALKVKVACGSVGTEVFFPGKRAEAEDVLGDGSTTAWCTASTGAGMQTPRSPDSTLTVAPVTPLVKAPAPLPHAAAAAVAASAAHRGSLGSQPQTARALSPRPPSMACPQAGTPRPSSVTSRGTPAGGSFTLPAGGQACSGSFSAGSRSSRGAPGQASPPMRLAPRCSGASLGSAVPFGQTRFGTPTPGGAPRITVGGGPGSVGGRRSMSSSCLREKTW